MTAIFLHIRAWPEVDAISILNFCPRLLSQSHADFLPELRNSHYFPDEKKIYAELRQRRKKHILSEAIRVILHKKAISALSFQALTSYLCFCPCF